MKDGVYVVTGGASGIGQACVSTLQAQGRRVAVLDIIDVNDAAYDSTTYFQCDITDEAAVDRIFTDINTQFGDIGGLINCAGMLADGLLVKPSQEGFSRLSYARFKQVLEVNLNGTFLCSRAVAPFLIKAQQGVIVNVSSVARVGNKGQSAYAASKAAVDALTTTWAQELGQCGIRVAGVAPGFVDTPMVALMREDMRAKQLAKVPLKRMATTTEIGDAVGFVVDNQYFTGRTLELDGGLRF